MTGWRKPARIEALVLVPMRKSRPVPLASLKALRQVDVMQIDNRLLPPGLAASLSGPIGN